MRIALLGLGTLLMVVVGLGCAMKRPVLYPNNHLRSVGMETAQNEIFACLEEAKLYVKASRTGRVAKETAAGAAVGGATGAAVGAVTSYGRGAAAGAAGGAARSFMRGVIGSRNPDPVEKAFVERCLRDRGYETIGWR